MYLKDSEQFQKLKHSLPDKISHALHNYVENSVFLKSEKMEKLKNTAKEKAKLAKDKARLAKDKARLAKELATAKVKAKVTVNCESSKSSPP